MSGGRHKKARVSGQGGQSRRLDAAFTREPKMESGLWDLARGLVHASEDWDCGFDEAVQDVAEKVARWAGINLPPKPVE